MKNPKPRNKTAISWGVAVGASLLAATGLSWWTGWGARAPGLWAGWMSAWVIVAAGHGWLRAALRTDVRAPSRFLAGFVFVRLLILLILIFVVVMTNFLRAEPFVTGLLSAYFAGAWMEIAWLASRSSGL